MKSHDHRTTLPRDPTMMSASRQTIVVKLYDLVRLSYDGHKMSDDFPTIVPDASQTHRIQCDHKIKIVISQPSPGQSWISRISSHHTMS